MALEKQEHIKMHSYPGMAVLIGAFHQHKVNFMAAGWHSYLSIHPHLYGVAIARQRHSYEMVKNSGKFSISFLPYEGIDFLQFCGRTSGSKTNKPEAFNTPWDLLENCYPVLPSAYLAYTCDVDQIIATGDHDWVVGAIQACYHQPNLFDAEELPLFKNFNIPLYLGKSTYLKIDEKVERKTISNPRPLGRSR